MLKRVSLYFLSAWLLVFILSSLTPAHLQQKAVYGILLDNSRSLEKQFPHVLMLGKGVVNRLHERGPISLFSFSTKHDLNTFIISERIDADEGGNSDLAVVKTGTEWSQDENAMAHYIDGLSVVKGQTDLFDSIRLMAETLSAKGGAEKGAFEDKILILITDGEHRMENTGQNDASLDERSKQERQLIKTLKESRVRVYAVGLIRELSAYGGLHGMTTKDIAESFLKRLAKETGGRVVFPKSKKFDADVLLNELFSP